MSRSTIGGLAAALALAAAFALPATTSATFAGVNGRISYAEFVPATNGFEIFTDTAAGSSPLQVTVSGQDRSSIFSDWSPDGSAIAFDSDRIDADGRDDVVQIYSMPWNGGSATQLTHGPGFHGDPAWSPDGRSVAIESDWGNYPASEGIWIIPVTGASGPSDPGVRRVTVAAPAAVIDSEPQFSPDGSRIVFSRYQGCNFARGGHQQGRPAGCLQAIFTVRTDGSDLRQLTVWGHQTSAPDWSPDGTRITFDGGDLGVAGSKGDIWVMNADGSHQTRIYTSPPVSDLGHDYVNLRFDFGNNPVWSPDGQWILFTHWTSNGSELLRIHPDGSDPTVAVPDGVFKNKADWGTHP